MEIRNEFREVKNKTWKVQFIDYTDAASIDEWKVTFYHTKRIPEYYSTVHIYAAQIPGKDRKDFYCVSGDYLEDVVRTNMGGGFRYMAFMR